MPSGPAPGPLLIVSPARGLVDEKFEVVVQELGSGQGVTLHALLQSEDGDFWEAFGHYVSDALGTVSAVKHASIGGSYLGIEPMGLLWSMKPVPGSRPGLRLRKMDVCSPSMVYLSVLRGHLSQGFREATPLACAVAERWYLAPGVRRVEVNEKGVKGTMFLPPGPGPFAGVLDMWGGGGGLVEYRSALLASHGFVSLALEYLPLKQPNGTPPGFTLGYFETAFRIVQEHPLVATDCVALFGLSLGASVSIGLASLSSVAHPACCVCINGGHIYPDESARNSDSWRTSKEFEENNNLIWRNHFLPLPDDPSQKMHVEKITCPMMLIVGLDDQNWAAAECAQDMERMMTKAGNGGLLTMLLYPETGHLIEPPYTPHFRSSNFIIPHNRKKVTLLWGGQPKPHTDAQEDSWRKILQFLRLHLYQGRGVVMQSRL